MKLFKLFTVLIFFQPFVIIMPSSRRSQNLPLKHSLISSRISSRSKTSSDKLKTDTVVKVKADAARKVKTDVAAKIIVDAVVNVNCSRNFKRHIIDNFKAAKKTCEAHVIDLQRQTNAISSR